MKTSILLMLIIGFVTLSSCSPFGNESIINIYDSIAEIFDGKTAAEVNSGGAESVFSSPQSGLVADRHDIEISIGSSYSQASTITSPDGHEVLITLSGVE